MRIVDILELSVPISRYADQTLPSGGLTTSMVVVITDVLRGGKPVAGYRFASIGRFAQGGLIRERFAPRLLAARDGDLVDEAGTSLDPFRAWKVMMTGEKLGGHGERCVAVGTLSCSSAPAPRLSNAYSLPSPIPLNARIVVPRPTPPPLFMTRQISARAAPITSAAVTRAILCTLT